MRSALFNLESIMVEIVLNIGLARGDGFHVSTLEALRVLNTNGVFVNTSEVFESDTEETLVVTGSLSGHDSKENTESLHRVAQALGQDCIAVWSPLIHFGALIGPRAAAWGEFNPAFFILPDGKRLA